MEWLDVAGDWTIVLGGLWGVFAYVILRPLNRAIAELQVAVQELRHDLRTCEERRHVMEIKVAKVDQRAKAAHRRIDELIKGHVKPLKQCKGEVDHEGLEHR